MISQQDMSRPFVSAVAAKGSKRRVVPPNAGELQRCARAPRAGRASGAMRARSRGARAERARALGTRLISGAGRQSRPFARRRVMLASALRARRRSLPLPLGQASRRAAADCTAAARRAAYRAHPPPGAHAAALWSMPRTLLMPLTGREPGPPAAGRCAGRRMAPVAGGGGCEGQRSVRSRFRLLKRRETGPAGARGQRAHRDERGEAVKRRARRGVSAGRGSERRRGARWARAKGARAGCAQELHEVDGLPEELAEDAQPKPAAALHHLA